MQKILAVFFRDNLRVHSELRKPLGAVGFQELLNMLPEEAAEILQTQLSGTRRFDLQPLHIFQISGQHVRKDQRGRPDGSAGKSGQVAGQPGVNDGLQRHGEQSRCHNAKRGGQKIPQHVRFFHISQDILHGRILLSYFIFREISQTAMSVLKNLHRHN